jgi:RHS repeat-associated protein
MVRLIGAIALTVIASWWIATASMQSTLRANTPQPNAETPAGQSATLMPDGRVLLIGGDGAQWRDPVTGAVTPVGGTIFFARAWHTATLLPDGTVLVLGGVNEGGEVISAPERFDPVTEIFEPLPVTVSPRAHHTVTVLPDERVLIVGGQTPEGTSATSVEMMNPARTETALTVRSVMVERHDHQATLLPDGTVRLDGGMNGAGDPLTDSALLDPLRSRIVPASKPDAIMSSTTVRTLSPSNDSTDVPTTAHLVFSVSEPIDVRTINRSTVSLSGADGPVGIRVVPVEAGRLIFVAPERPLEPGTTYTLTGEDASDMRGNAVTWPSVTFTTAGVSPSGDTPDQEAWTPDARSIETGWRTGRPPSPWESLPPLIAPPGVTAISGRVLTLDGRPLRNVTLTLDEGTSTATDRTGRFVLLVTSPMENRCVLAIDGRTASRPGRTYGLFEWGMKVETGRTNVLPATIWMPRLDTSHVVTIPSPTTTEVVVTTPYIPGLELHIPPQTVIRGEDGKPVTQLGITPIPVDRPPFPLATNVDVPVYFTIQPGGAYVSTAGTGPKGAWLVYPNYRQGIPGQRIQFFHYDPEVKDWYVYGLGTVTPNTTQVAPDPTTRLYEFTGAMINGADSPPGSGPIAGGKRGGEPIDLATGIFSMEKTDLYLPDVVPLALTRTYNSGDNLDRSFGIGMQNPYAMFLWSANQYQEADLILPDGGKIHYVRTSPGVNWADAVFEHTATPTAFYKSTIVHRNSDPNGGWDLRLTDGTVFVMGENAPIQMIKDRYGNTLRIEHSNGQTGNVTRVISPNGRTLEFTYDTHTPKNHITQVRDNIGRTVTYTYDGTGRVSTVTDPENNVTTYTYDASNRLLTIKDGRNIVYLTNEYTNGRVTKQTLADSANTYQFAYTVDGPGNVTQIDVTNPQGSINRLTFNASHYVTSEVEAFSTSLQRTITTESQSGTNLVTAKTDGLNRRAEFTYDSSGHVLTETRLAGTGNAATTTFTYEPVFGQLATITDPLSHTWMMAYDGSGRLTSLTDPLFHQTGVSMNAVGQILQTTDPLQHTWQFGYFGADLISVTDPLNNVRRRFIDAAGRVLSTVDPLGRATLKAQDKLNRVTSITDALGGQTSLTYDPNNNVLSRTDALSHATTYTYDSFDRLATLTDPLTHAASYVYDANDNLTQTTDRKSQVTNSQYDALDRVTQVTFHDNSTISYDYDAGDRVTQIVDSANGTITRTYDGLNRLMHETTSQGTVDYSYDADGRRATMTVAGQTAMSYGYDNAHRLTSITQGTASIAMTYDTASRRSTLTFPNGILATYGYDNANQLTSLTYSLGQTTLGDITYTYNAAGHRTSVGGTWARTGVPAALSSATYDAVNRIAALNGTSFSYDFNGSLTNDGTTTYTWNVRNQLTGLSGGASASFAYDGIGRRRGKTVNGTTTNFFYDGLNLVQELTSGGTPTANLLTGLGIDETFTRTDASGVRTLLIDALDSTLALADAAGVVQTTYTYDPFGATTASGATNTNAGQFTGRENDGTGLYFLRARYYNPQLSRFLSEDPIGHAGGENLFVYGGNRPTQFIDPLGLKPSSGFGGGSGAAGAGGGGGTGAGGGGGDGGDGDDNGDGRSSKEKKKEKGCDPNCQSNCNRNLGKCLAALFTSWYVGVELPATLAVCAFVGVETGGVGVIPCLELLEPGLGVSKAIVWSTGVATCLAAYAVEYRRCQSCIK